MQLENVLINSHGTTPFKLNEIKKNLTPESTFELGCEECCELGQAFAKLARVMRQENPTPVTLEEALNNVEEEFVDILLVAIVARVPVNEDLLERKINRWYDRTNGNMERLQKEWNVQVQEHLERNSNQT